MSSTKIWSRELSILSKLSKKLSLEKFIKISHLKHLYADENAASKLKIVQVSEIPKEIRYFNESFNFLYNKLESD